MLSLRRPSPALVIAVIALFVAASGGAWAAGGGLTNGTAAATKKKKKKKKVTSTRGPRGPQGPPGQQGVTGPAGAAGASVQGPAGPSDGFVRNQPGATSLTAAADTPVAQLGLTAGSNYIVTAATELGNNGVASNLVTCVLLENNAPIGGGSANLPATAVFAQTITLTAATTGGTIRLSCNPTIGAQARNSVITAVRVGTLTRQ